MKGCTGDGSGGEKKKKKKLENGTHEKYRHAVRVDIRRDHLARFDQRPHPIDIPLHDGQPDRMGAREHPPNAHVQRRSLAGQAPPRRREGDEPGHQPGREDVVEHGRVAALLRVPAAGGVARPRVPDRDAAVVEEHLSEHPREETPRGLGRSSPVALAGAAPSAAVSYGDEHVKMLTTGLRL